MLKIALTGLALEAARSNILNPLESYKCEREASDIEFYTPDFSGGWLKLLLYHELEEFAICSHNYAAYILNVLISVILCTFADTCGFLGP